MGALVYGHSRIELTGNNSVTGQNTVLTPDNQLSYLASLGVTSKWMDPVHFRFSVGRIVYRTQAYRATGANDQGSYETRILDGGITVQLNLNNKLGLSIGASHPIKVEIHGPLNNQVGRDTYELQGNVGFNASFSYHFDKHLHFRTTYLHNSTVKSHVDTNLELHGIFKHFTFELGVTL